MVFVKGKNKRQCGNTLRILHMNIQNKKLLFVQFQILNWRWRQDIVFTATDMNTDHVTWDFSLSTAARRRWKAVLLSLYLLICKIFLSLLKQFNRKLFSFFSHGSIKESITSGNIDKYNGAKTRFLNQIYCENCALNHFLLNTDGSYMHPSYKADNSSSLHLWYLDAI